VTGLAIYTVFTVSHCQVLLVDYLNTVTQKYFYYVELHAYECKDFPSTLSLAALTWNDFKISITRMALLRLWVFTQLHGALPFGGPRKGLIADLVSNVLFEHPSSRKEKHGSPYKRVHRHFPVTSQNTSYRSA